MIALERHGPQPIHDHFQGRFAEEHFAETLVQLIKDAMRAMLSRPLGDPSELHETDGPRKHAVVSKPLWQIDVYDQRHGGTPPGPYAALRQCLTAGSAKFVLDAIKTFGLVGMGGAAAQHGEEVERRSRPQGTAQVRGLQR